MAKFTIYSPDGTALDTGTPTFTGQYMKPGMLEFREIASPKLIDFSAGCYVGYEVNGTVVPQYSRTGFTYKLYSVPQVKKQARPYSYGAAFVYQGVQFFDASKELELCPFRDLVTGDNRIHFSTQPSISTFEGCDGLAGRFEACLREQYDENGVQSWQVRIATPTDGVTQDFYNLMRDAREFTVSGVNILECLDKIYEIWPEVGWVYTVETVNGNPTNTIIIGGAGLNANQGTYAYGKGRGLTSITRTAANADEMANRIYAYGDARNMLPKWYNGLDIKDKQSVDIQNLMIPVSHWGTTDSKPDASKAYVENGASIDRIGLRPKTIYFDGTGEYPAIYPTIRNKTIGDLWAVMSSTDQYYPKPSKYLESSRIDTLLSAQEGFDTGLAGATGTGKDTIYNEYLPIDYELDSESIEAGSRSWARSIITEEFTFGSDESGTRDITMSVSMNGYVDIPGITNAMITASLRKGHPSNVDGAILTKEVDLVKDTATGNYNFTSFTMHGQRKAIEVASYYLVIDLALEFSSAPSGTSLDCEVSGNVSLSLANYRAKTFNITLRQIGFDISAQAVLGEGKTIAMRSGKCQGRTFTINTVQYDSTNDTWNLECFRSEDESLSQWFPNSQYPVRGKEANYDGDEFVLLDIALPSVYISMAENELYQAALDLLSDTAVERWQYVPEIDAKFMVENSRTIRSGEYMAILDMDFIEPAEGTASYFKTSDDVYLLTSNGEKIRLDDGSGSVTTALVDTIVINEGEAAIPTYKVTLRDRKKKTWTESKGAELPPSRSVGSITETQTTQSSSAVDSKYFMLDDSGNITLKPQYSNLWVPGWLAAGGVGTGGGGGGDTGVSFLKELNDVYHSNSGVLRADGTAVQPGDSLVYNATLGWLASPVSGGSGGGTDLPTVWNSLTNSVADQFANTQINIAHIPNLTASKITDLDTWVAGKGFLTTETDPTVPAWAKQTNPSFYIGTTQVQTEPNDQALTGILSINATSSAQSASRIVWEPNAGGTGIGAWHFYGNMYADGWVAAGGIGTGSSGGSYTAGTGIDITNNVISLQTASTSALGGVKVDGTTITINNGVISAVGGGGGTTYTAGYGISISSNNTISLKAASENEIGGLRVKVPSSDPSSINAISTTSGRYYYIQRTSGGTAFVNVPWESGGGGSTYTAGTGINISSSDVISISSAYQTKIANGETAYGWGNHATAGYAQASALNNYVTLSGNPQTITGQKTFTGYPVYIGTDSGLSMVSTSYIEIGDARIEYDSGSYALRVTKKSGTSRTIGFYADGFVSAGGTAASSSRNIVYTDGDQTITGTKTFSGPINGLTITKSTNYVSLNNESSYKHLVLGSGSGGVFVGSYSSSATSYKFYVSGGNVRFTDNATASSWETSSDRRLKDNITPLSKDDAIEKIMALAPSTWEWKEGVNKGMTAAGFVAQDVESVIPFMVGGHEYKSLAYQMLHAYEVSAIQSHEARIKVLENKILEG